MRRFLVTLLLLTSSVCYADMTTINKKGQISLSLESTYQEQVEWMDRVVVGSHYVPAGTFYYSRYAGYTEYEYEDRLLSRMESRTENVNMKLTGDRFAEIYLAVIQSKDSDNRKLLIDFLQKLCGEEVHSAQDNLKARLAQFKREERKKLRGNISKLDDLSLPNL